MSAMICPANEWTDAKQSRCGAGVGTKDCGMGPVARPWVPRGLPDDPHSRIVPHTIPPRSTTSPPTTAHPPTVAQGTPASCRASALRLRVDRARALPPAGPSARRPSVRTIRDDDSRTNPICLSLCALLRQPAALPLSRPGANPPPDIIRLERLFNRLLLPDRYAREVKHDGGRVAPLRERDGHCAKVLGGPLSTQLPRLHEARAGLGRDDLACGGAALWVSAQDIVTHSPRTNAPITFPPKSSYASPGVVVIFAALRAHIGMRAGSVSSAQRSWADAWRRVSMRTEVDGALVDADVAEDAEAGAGVEVDVEAEEAGAALACAATGAFRISPGGAGLYRAPSAAPGVLAPDPAAWPCAAAPAASCPCAATSAGRKASSRARRTGGKARRRKA